MTLFTKIIDQDIPSFKILEDENFYAFLDIRPIYEGHTLVVPKYEVDHFFDMKEDSLATILLFAKPIVKAIEAAIPCERVGSIVAGTEVPHAHLHLVPIVDMSRFSFSYAKQASPDQLLETQSSILNHLKTFV